MPFERSTHWLDVLRQGRLVPCTAKPSVTTPKAEAIEPQAPTRTATRVLLVDDHVDTREMYAILLRDRGYLVYEAADGPSALTTVRSIQLDAAIVDISLPGMDGYELARQVRADVSQSRVALIAVTGHGLPEHLALSRLVGFDAHLVKPVSPNDLFKVLDTLAPGGD